MKILYINPSNHECGIYQYGLRVYNALKTFLPDWCDCEIQYAENFDNVQQHVDHDLTCTTSSHLMSS